MRSCISRDRCSHKMPGDEWQKLANLRLLLAYMFTRPGKKLLFMGTELAPPDEWNHDASLDWHLRDEPERARVRALRRRGSARSTSESRRSGATIRAGTASAGSTSPTARTR